MILEKEFLEVYERYKKNIYAVIFNYVRNEDDAAEILQEVFIKYLNSDGNFQSEEHRKAWLIRVAINMCKNHFRASKHIAEEPVDENMAQTEEYHYDEVLQYVLKLPEKYRIPIHLFFYEGYSIREIAEVTDLPEATVKTRLKRGKEALRKTLEQEAWM